MTTPLMSMGSEQRRQHRAGHTPPLERLVVLGLLATLTVSAALMIADSMSSSEPTAQVEPSNAAATFVESSSTDVVAEPAINAISDFEAFTEAPGLYRVLGESPVNIRVSPGVQAATVGQVAPGDALLAMSTGKGATNGSENWMQIEIDGTTGWVRSDLMTGADAN